MKIGHTADKPTLAPSVTSPTSSPAGDAAKGVSASPKVDDSAQEIGRAHV